MTRIAAIDVGSLTVRLAVAEAAGPGRFQVLAHRREITGLGRGFKEGGCLDPDAVSRTLAALREFGREMASMGVNEARAVATQAVRQAKDGQEFLVRAGEALGAPVHLISPAEEARLTLIGVLSALDPEILAHGPVVVFDVGGGSSEFVLLRPGEEPFFAGLPLGVLSASEAQPVGDPPEPERVSALSGSIAHQVKKFYKKNFTTFLAGPPVLVGTAGAVTTLAAMDQEMREYDPQRVNNYRLGRDRLENLAARLAALPEAERAKLPGIEPAKAGVMVAGAFIVLSILQVFGRDYLVSIDAGLLEGLLAEMAL